MSNRKPLSGQIWMLKKFSRNHTATESGQGILEYAMIFTLVVILLVVLIYFFGDQVNRTYIDILDKLPF